MKIKKISACIIAAVISIIIIDVLFIYKKNKNTVNDKCVAVMEIHDNKSGFSTLISSVLVMTPQEKGYIAMSGHVSYQRHTYEVSRVIKFSYEKQGGVIYKLTDLVLTKHTADNAPDILMNGAFFSMLHEEERYMTMRRVRNAYIIGNLHSPVFMCVVKKTPTAPS